MTSITIRAITNCDERTASLQGKIDALIPMMKFAKLMGVSSYDDRLANYQTQIKLIKTEKLIYQSIMNANSRQEIFPKLLAKYDELMEESQYLISKMVRSGLEKEEDYLEYCKSTMGQRSYIKTMCDEGKKGYRC
jgi:hypothetical protein